MRFHFLRDAALAACCSSLVLLAGPSVAAPKADSPGAEHARVVAYWTKERIAAAIPRDLRIDERGYGYLRQPNGTLAPYGHTIAAQSKPAPQQPMAKPGGDTTLPSISNRDPAVGATIGASYTFKATVTDASGVRSVSFKIGLSGGLQQSFAASAGAGGVYSAQISGFSNGTWTWSVVAKDNANNTATSAVTSFTVNTGGGGGGGGNVVANAPYSGGGTIQNAVGRIYFEMPSNSRLTRWAGYVCSGTVVTDETSGRSIVQTAAHCVYDDAYKAFARNVLFIPNQAASGTGTDTNCSNDVLGCWSPSFGVVDVNWTTRTFPDNVAWDYAYYVFNNTSHLGAGAGGVLDFAVVPIDISFGVPYSDVASDTTDYTTALGYSYSEDPNFMFCAEDMQEADAANWWLDSCGLSGGSSGGPWMQPFSGGTGSLISVNSWGYTNQPGMAGPKLSGNSAACVFGLAKSTAFASVPTTDGQEGVKLTTCP